jgi:hypothetical protein
LTGFAAGIQIRTPADEDSFAGGEVVAGVLCSGLQRGAGSDELRETIRVKRGRPEPTSSYRFLTSVPIMVTSVVHAVCRVGFADPQFTS